MHWRGTQIDSRNRYLARFDAEEVARYDALVGKLGPADEDAYLADLANVVDLRQWKYVLDAGAGTGTVSQLLSRFPGMALTALEPAPAMVATLKTRPELVGVTAVEGFCDSLEDRRHFTEARFDAIVSRQLVNGLFDPLTAFKNWHFWLHSQGRVVVIDGLYGRSAWTGVWQDEVDVLPLSACQNTACIPYLLELAGFQVETVQLMAAVNRLPATRTPRYVVVARKSI